MAIGKRAQFLKFIHQLLKERSPLINKRYFALLQGDLAFLKMESKFNSLSIVSQVDQSETNFCVHNDHFRFEGVGFDSSSQGMMSSSIKLIESHSENKLHFVEVEIETGRKHQIRKQCSLVLNAPVVG